MAIALVVIAVLVIIVLVCTAYVVPQQQAYIIERFGKFHAVKFAGIHCKLPLIDRIAIKTNMRVSQLNVKIETKTLDNVFVEIKKKYDGVVYKRRIVLPAREAALYLKSGLLTKPSQISREINWLRNRLPLKPKVFIGYDREAYAGIQGIENPELRVTFDTNLRYREDRLDLRKGDDGYPLLDSGKILMEIKIPGAAPLWLARLLSENDIHMTSFSKYGTYYQSVVMGHGAANTKENQNHVRFYA